MLNIPQQGWNSLHLLTLFTVKGSNLLTKQEVCNLKPFSISRNHENIISFLSSLLAKMDTIERVPCDRFFGIQDLLLLRARTLGFKGKVSNIQDFNYEQDVGFSDFMMLDSGNNAVKGNIHIGKWVIFSFMLQKSVHFHSKMPTTTCKEPILPPFYPTICCWLSLGEGIWKLCKALWMYVQDQY